MFVTAEKLNELKKICTQIRRNIIKMIHNAQSGHPGGALSSVEILVALYHHIMNHNPNNPHAPLRDRFVISKGHACAVLYTTLASCGYFPEEMLMTFRKLWSPLQGHPVLQQPTGVEMTAGSLGQGLSYSIGIALSARIKKQSYRVYCLIGDGELNEGQIWEAAMFAAHHKIDNLVAIIDRNYIQQTGATEEIIKLNSVSEKFKSFGWHTFEIDGHNIKEVIETLEKAKEIREKPVAIVARTVKGKGVSFMENNVNFHGKAPNEKEFQQAMKELELG